MKKRFLFLVLALMLCLSVGATALAMARAAGGHCTISNVGRNVSFSGYFDSGQTEDRIGVTVTLWEQQGSSWVSVDSKSKELRNIDYVEVAGNKIVDGRQSQVLLYKYTGVRVCKSLLPASHVSIRMALPMGYMAQTAGFRLWTEHFRSLSSGHRFMLPCGFKRTIGSLESWPI